MTADVALERMPQQAGLLGAEDDWTGVTSSAARRRVQNRINQRAYRKRKMLEGKMRVAGGLQSLPQGLQSNGSTSSETSSNSDSSEVGVVERGAIEHDLWRLFLSTTDHSPIDRQKLSRVATICKLGALEQQRLICEFKRWMGQCQRMGSPTADQLLVLVKFNVLRGIVSNGADLGFAAKEGVYDDDSLSPFTDPSNPMWLLRSVPVALQPTRLQRQIPHHPWIDVLPSPKMRDNLLLAGDEYDVDDLCNDLVGFFTSDSGRIGMIVWGEPWDVAGWEVTESFVKRWGWTIQGCEELLRATNYWRVKRGERPIRFGRVLCEEG